MTLTELKDAIGVELTAAGIDPAKVSTITLANDANPVVTVGNRYEGKKLKSFTITIYETE